MTKYYKNLGQWTGINFSDRIWREKFVDVGDNFGIMGLGGESINTPIELGHPADVAFGAKKLSLRQQRILNLLPGYGSQAVLRKRDVKMLDLSAMTAETGDEFAMFTRKGERLIIRGDNSGVPLTLDELGALRNGGYRWSGHTHPGRGEASLISSDGDKRALRQFGQSNSVIYNSFGKRRLIYP